jgi:hypothetical protein
MFTGIWKRYGTIMDMDADQVACHGMNIHPFVFEAVKILVNINNPRYLAEEPGC